MAKRRYSVFKDDTFTAVTGFLVDAIEPGGDAAASPDPAFADAAAKLLAPLARWHADRKATPEAVREAVRDAFGFEPQRCGEPTRERDRWFLLREGHPVVWEQTSDPMGASRLLVPPDMPPAAVRGVLADLYDRMDFPGPGADVLCPPPVVLPADPMPASMRAALEGVGLLGYDAEGTRIDLTDDVRAGDMARLRGLRLAAVKDDGSEVPITDAMIADFTAADAKQKAATAAGGSADGGQPVDPMGIIDMLKKSGATIIGVGAGGAEVDLGGDVVRGDATILHRGDGDPVTVDRGGLAVGGPVAVPGPFTPAPATWDGLDDISNVLSPRDPAWRSAMSWDSDAGLLRIGRGKESDVVLPKRLREAASAAFGGPPTEVAGGSDAQDVWHLTWRGHHVAWSQVTDGPIGVGNRLHVPSDLPADDAKELCRDIAVACGDAARRPASMAGQPAVGVELRPIPFVRHIFTAETDDDGPTTCVVLQPVEAGVDKPVAGYTPVQRLAVGIVAAALELDANTDYPSIFVAPYDVKPKDLAAMFDAMGIPADRRFTVAARAVEPCCSTVTEDEPDEVWRSATKAPIGPA